MRAGPLALLASGGRLPLTGWPWRAYRAVGRAQGRCPAGVLGRSPSCAVGRCPPSACAVAG
eukprot:10676413-Alexandrium_andersonii.AAC.2